MQVVFVVLHKTELLQDLLTKLKKAGVSGGTIIDSQGMISYVFLKSASHNITLELYQLNVITIPALLTTLPDSQNLKLPLPDPCFSLVPINIQSTYSFAPLQHVRLLLVLLRMLPAFPFLFLPTSA